jgi:hypothetical protein
MEAAEGNPFLFIRRIYLIMGKIRRFNGDTNEELFFSNN